MSISDGPNQAPTGNVVTDITDLDLSLLDDLRKFDWGTDTFQLAAVLGRPPEELEMELSGLVAKGCIGTIAYQDGRPSAWFIEITNSSELARLREANNPDDEPVGHFTGRCMTCESDDLWTDDTAYGCKCCGASYATGDTAPRKVENGTGRDLGPAW